jgi:ATP-binding protein involved in chromosome partitioning
MSYYCCPNCGHRADIFSHGGARREAQRLGAEFLGEVPLLLEIRTASDAGAPIAASAPDSEAARAFGDIAARVWARTEALLSKRAAPRIVID